MVSGIKDNHILSFAFSPRHASAHITPYVVKLLESVGSQEIWERGPAVEFLEEVEDARESIG